VSSRVPEATRAASKADFEDEGDRPRYIPICPNCQQRGRKRAAKHPEPGRHFICVVCDTRWAVQAPES
jgi:hypothetical protein